MVLFLFIYFFKIVFSPYIIPPHTLFVADQGQAGNTESLGQEPADSGKSEKQ